MEGALAGWEERMDLEELWAVVVANGDSVARLEELEGVGWALGAAEE